MSWDFLSSILGLDHSPQQQTQSFLYLPANSLILISTNTTTVCKPNSSGKHERQLDLNLVLLIPHQSFYFIFFSSSH